VSNPAPHASLSFDRAAEYYDETRALPDAAQRRVIELLVSEVRNREPCLEIGVGTGRIALPLFQAGIKMVGADLSAPMLLKLEEKAGGAPFPLLRADATALPFRDGIFSSAIACHVLHLIPEWRDAIGELARTVRPGGTVLIEIGEWGHGEWERIVRRFCEEAAIPMRHRGVNEIREVDDAMAALGAATRPLPPVESHITKPFGELIDGLANGTYSLTWQLGDDARKRAAGATRVWAEASFGSLDRECKIDSDITWRAYDLPDRGPTTGQEAAQS
jgi:ubiquinone/menaquinone biosynthesis C-methylase UbiE